MSNGAMFFVSFTLAFSLQIREKHVKKTLVTVVEKCQLGTIQYVD